MESAMYSCKSVFTKRAERSRSLVLQKGNQSADEGERPSWSAAPMDLPKRKGKCGLWRSAPARASLPSRGREQVRLRGRGS